MAPVRQAAVAGMFYPGTAPELRETVERFLALAETPQGPPPKAIIAPHAGYVFSGAVAASVYARLRPAAGRLHKVVLLGPCHRVPVRGLAASSAEQFMTPLGPVPVDRAAVDDLLTLPQVTVFDAPHLQEHSLEVHLPFLQVILGDFSLIPLVVGAAPAEEIAEVLERVWGGPETLIVVSSDLSHYEPYEAARRLDDSTRHAIEDLAPARIGDNQACGRFPLAGLLTVARRKHLRVETLDLRNSGDTAGPRDQVVGYGSWAFFEPEAGADRADTEPKGETARTPPPPAEDNFADHTRRILDHHGPTLLHVAAASIEHGLTQAQQLPVQPGDYAEDLGAFGASFVTLKRAGVLRGCIGSSVAHRPLVEDVAENAFSAAFKDPRFPPLTREETDGLVLSLSLLSTPAPLGFRDEADLLRQLRPGIDGLVIEDAGRRALFLPAVWENLAEPETFLSQLKLKAGLLAGHWSGGFKAWRFVTEGISSEALADPASLWSSGALGS